MNVDQKSLESRAMDIYCQLADIENLLNTMNFAARAEEENIERPKVICWHGMILLVKREVRSVLDLAEELEHQIRMNQRNKSEVDSEHISEPNSGHHDGAIGPE